VSHTETARLSACEGKRVFKSFAAAQRHGVSSERIKRAGARPYHCRECGLFHIGSQAVFSKAPPKSRLIAREDRPEKFTYANDYDRRKGK